MIRMSSARLVFILTILATARFAAIAQDDLGEKIDRFVAAHEKATDFSGSVLVAKDGKILVRKGYGQAVREWAVPATPETKYRLGSVTKQFTAMAILQLKEKGKLAIEDSVTKYVDGLPETWKPITIHQLVTHTAGLSNFTDWPEFDAQKANPKSPRDVIADVAKKPLDFEPGSKFAYSNSGYVLLGLVIEKAAGESYESFLRKNIFEPLGMKNTGYDHTEEILPMRAKGYTLGPSGDMVTAAYIDMGIPFAAGALYSTVDDLYLWLQALETEKLIPAKTMELALTPEKGNYAYGWMIARMDDKVGKSHGGGIDGFRTNVTHFPGEKIAVIVLSNSESAAVGEMDMAIVSILFGHPYKEPTVRTEVKVDPKILDGYVGEYELAPTFSITIRRKGARLFAQATRQNELPAYAESETKFFLKVIDAQIEFVAGADGKIEKLILHQNGRSSPGKRKS